MSYLRCRVQGCEQPAVAIDSAPTCEDHRAFDRVATLEAEVVRLGDVIARLDAEIAQYIDANVNMRERLAAAEAERDKLRDDCDELRHQTETQTEMTRRTLLYGDTMKGERNAAQARLATAEAVVEAAREVIAAADERDGITSRDRGEAVKRGIANTYRGRQALAVLRVALDALTQPREDDQG